MWQPKELDEADTKLLLVVVVVGRIEENFGGQQMFLFFLLLLFGSVLPTTLICVSAAAVICKYAFVCLVIVVSCIFSSSLTTITKKTYTLEALKNVHQVFHYNFFRYIMLVCEGIIFNISNTQKKKEFLTVGRNKLVFFSSWHVVWGEKGTTRMVSTWL